MVFAASFAFDIFSTRPRSAAWFTSESGNAPNAGSNHLFSAPRIDGTLLSGIGRRFLVRRWLSQTSDCWRNVGIGISGFDWGGSKTNPRASFTSLARIWPTSS